MEKVTLLIALLALAGCQTMSGDFCTLAKPIRLSHVVIDVMSDAEVADVLAHNEKLAALCRVRP